MWMKGCFWSCFSPLLPVLSLLLLFVGFLKCCCSKETEFEPYCGSQKCIWPRFSGRLKLASLSSPHSHLKTPFVLVYRQAQSKERKKETNLQLEDAPSLFFHVVELFRKEKSRRLGSLFQCPQRPDMFAVKNEEERKGKTHAHTLRELRLG